MFLQAAEAYWNKGQQITRGEIPHAFESANPAAGASQARRGSAVVEHQVGTGARRVGRLPQAVGGALLSPVPGCRAPRGPGVPAPGEGISVRRPKVCRKIRAGDWPAYASKKPRQIAGAPQVPSPSERATAAGRLGQCWTPAAACSTNTAADLVQRAIACRFGWRTVQQRRPNRRSDDGQMTFEVVGQDPNPGPDLLIYEPPYGIEP
jgi:hypothetical protein